MSQRKTSCQIDERIIKCKMFRVINEHTRRESLILNTGRKSSIMLFMMYQFLAAHLNEISLTQAK